MKHTFDHQLAFGIVKSPLLYRRMFEHLTFQNHFLSGERLDNAMQQPTLTHRLGNATGGPVLN